MKTCSLLLHACLRFLRLRVPFAVLLCWLMGTATATPYSFILGATNVVLGPASGSNSVVLGASATNAGWTASTTNSWLSVPTGSGMGSTNIVFEFDSNAGATRTGTLTIAGQTVSVTQAGSTYVAAAGEPTTLVGSGLSRPYGLAVDATGNVYIADTQNNAIKEWIAASNIVVTLISNGINFPSGVAVDGAGNIYFVNDSANPVQKLTAGGGGVTTLVSSSDFFFAVAVDGASNVYVTDVSFGRVSEWIASNSNFVSLASGLSSPNGLALDAATNLYISDSGSGEVQELSAATSNLTVVIPNEFGTPGGVGVDGSGNLFFPNDSFNAIDERSAVAGTVSELVGGGLNQPNGVAVDSAGNVYIADTINSAIKEYPHAFVDPTPKTESLAAGSDTLPAVLPATANLTGPFAPTSDESWLTITGVTNGVVSFSFDGSEGPTRTAHITVLGQQIAVTQPTFMTALGTTNRLEGPFAGMDSVALNGPPAWTATANASWLHLSVTNGSGSTNVIFSFDVNPGATRTNTLTIAGLTVTVVQAGSAFVAASATPTTIVSSGLSDPESIAVDGVGNVYIADSGNFAIKEWVAATDTVTNLVTSGINYPEGVAVDAFGNVFISDTYHAEIKEWSVTNRSVSIVVSSNELYLPQGITLDSAGDIFITDNGTFSVYEWNAASSNLITLVPSGDIDEPYDLAVDVATNVYVASMNDNRIDELSPPFTNAIIDLIGGLSSPLGVATDGAGNVYIADTGHNAIKESVVASNSVTTLVSSGIASPFSVAVDSAGDVYFTDTNNSVIKEIPHAFVDSATRIESSAGGTDALPAVLPATANLTGPFAPSTDQSWLTITSVSNGVVSFSFAATSSNRTGHITLLGQAIPVVQEIPPQLLVFNGASAITNNQLTPQNFGNVVLNGTGPVFTFTISNAGGQSLDVGTPSVPLGFSLVTNPPASIAGGSNGQFSVRLNSTNVGFVSGSISFTNNDTNNDPFSFAVSGAVLSPPSIAVFIGTNSVTNGQTVSFGSVQQSSSAPAVTFAVANAGQVPLTLGLQTPAVPSGFLLVSNLASTVASNGIALFTVQLTTSNAGVFAGNITITNNSTNTPFAFTVTGTVLPPPMIAVSPSPANFGTNIQGSTGSTVTFTITNAGGEPLLLGVPVLPTGFLLSAAPPGTITASNSTTFRVQLNTSNAGSFSGNISITNNSANNPLNVGVSGTVLPSSNYIVLGGNLNFGVVTVGAMATNSFTISNLGPALLTVSNIVFSNAAAFTASWTNGTIAASNSQQVTVVFKPAAPTNYSGLVTVDCNATAGATNLAVTAFGANDSFLLTIITNGPGTVTPNDAKILKQGAKVSLRAAPVGANVFAGWSGSTNSTNNPLVFTMEQSTIVQANFIANPFLAFVGAYNGLFWPSNGVAENSAGMLKNLVLTSKGTYTASLLLEGATKAFSGAFNVAGQATKTIPFSGPEGSVYLTMNLASNETAPQITGIVSNASWVATNLVADRATNNNSVASAYTLLIERDTNIASAPIGDGYALIAGSPGSAKIAASAKISGSLADGTTFSASAPVSLDGYVPVYESLYGGKGLLLGWINLGASNASMAWIHPFRPGLFPSAFTATNLVTLSPWSNSPPLIALPTNLVILETNGSGALVTNAFTLNITNGTYKFGQASGPAVSLAGSIDAKTGLLTITTGTGAAKVSGKGVVILNATNGGGYILTRTNAQAILLAPQ